MTTDVLENVPPTHEMLNQLSAVPAHLKIISQSLQTPTPSTDKKCTEDCNEEQSNISQNKIITKKAKKSSSFYEDLKSLYHSVPQIRSHFKVLKKIGCGTFSNVYLAVLRKYGDKSPLFALKHIFSTSHPKRIENEVKCLKEMGGEQHVVGIECCIRNRGEVVVVMPYQKHDDFSDLLKQMSLEDIRIYMRHLLLALYRVHQNNVIHRDIKPNNFLFDLESKKSCLVDFGLAQFLPSSSSASLSDNHPQATAEASVELSSPTYTSSISRITGVPLNKTENTMEKSKENAPPKAKRRCLGEIQLNNLQRRNSEEVKKPFQNHKKSSTIEVRKLPRFGRSCNVENIFTKKAVNPLSKDLGKISLTSPTSTNDRSAADRNRKSGCVTFADVFPKIRKYCGSKQTLTSNRPKSKSEDKSCNCYGKLSVCYKCLARPSANASRAGTAGFRPPEVLLRYSTQTTAVDIWAAGVVFLTLLSGRCPFFRPADDLESLFQLILIFGSKKIQDVAKLLGRKITCSQHFPGYDLRGLVVSLREQEKSEGPVLRSSPRRQSSVENSPQTKSADDESASTSFSAVDIPESAFELLGLLLEPNPRTRITALKALYHDFLISDEWKRVVTPRSRGQKE